MLEELTNMKTLEDCTVLAAKLTNLTVRESFFVMLTNSGLVYLTDDMLTDEQLAYLSSQLMDNKLTFEKPRDKNAEARDIVQRLQLIGYCNAGVRAPIKRFLERACI